MGCDEQSRFLPNPQSNGNYITIHTKVSALINSHFSTVNILKLQTTKLQAWVFGALDDDASSVLYWTFAWIYTMPYVANGFELDGYAWFALILGVVHMQIERRAQTEPVEVELPSVLRSVLRSLPRAVTALGRYGSVVGEEVSERVGRSAEAQQRKPDRKYLEEKSREARMELDEFDRKRRQREMERRRRDGE